MTPDELREWRKAAGLTQAELGARIGLGLRAVQDMEADGGHLKTGHQLAVDMASMLLAAERRDASVLTYTALLVFVTLEGLVQPVHRARIDMAGVKVVLTETEFVAVRSFEATLGRELSNDERRDFATNFRAHEQARQNAAILPPPVRVS